MTLPVIPLGNLTDFSPLEGVTVRGVGPIDCSGLIVIVGPNSSGKSQLLRDIHLRVSGEPRRLVVADSVDVRRFPYEPLVEALKSEGLIQSFEDEAGNSQLRPLTTYAGTGQSAQQIPTNQGHQWFNQPVRSAANLATRRDDFLGYFGRFLVTALFLDIRLTALNRAGMIEFLTQPPTHDLQALYLNQKAREELLEEVSKSFGKAVWPDISGGSGVSLRVSDSPELPGYKDLLLPNQMAKYRTIETEGDGFKSYVATCVALLLGRRPICIVDEPELCLHPPQAYNLGRFIGRFGSSLAGTTFVATHSSQILRGVIQTAPKLQILRMTRVDGQFRAHLVSSEVLNEALKKPTVRAESVLDGIFSQAVVIVEADSDRTVYQAAWETLDRQKRLDIHFTTVGGAGGIADTCSLYGTLRIPVAVIADLDVITDSIRLRQILAALGSQQIATVMEEANRLIAQIKLLPPTISEADVRADLMAALPDTLSWSSEDDVPLKTNLRKVAQSLDRMRRLKSLDSSLPEPLRLDINALLDSLSSDGLFIVPVGELEDWLEAHAIQASRNNKWAWANEAAALIRDIGAQTNDVWKFVSRLGVYLDDRLQFLATESATSGPASSPPAV